MRIGVMVSEVIGDGSSGRGMGARLRLCEVE